MRVLHVSDLHVSVPLGRMPATGWSRPKRLLGGFNLALRRHRLFEHAEEKIRDLARLADEQRIDLVICTGDYTALGTGIELAAARRAIEPLLHRPAGFVTVPGNHDVYVEDSLGLFEQHFGDLLTTDAPELQRDGVWPLVRFIGDTVAVVAVSSARPNPQLWRSSGRIPAPQLEGLEDVLSDPRLRGRFVFVITHYAPRLANGKPDHYTHGLVNADELLRSVSKVSHGALLHGHVHRCYRLRVPGVGIPLVGAGSTTQAGSEGLWVFELEGTEAQIQRGRFTDGAYRLDPPEPL
ncbi:MAG: metallophosphoesterase [Sandaracinaceae bacterium]